jgi:hypothetical protein
MNISACKQCNGVNDSHDSQYVCSACGKRLLAKIYNLATVRFALTITGWVCLALIVAFMTFMYVRQPNSDTIRIQNRHGGTVTMSGQAFLLTGILLLAGAGGLLAWSSSTGRRITHLEGEYKRLTGTEAVYDIRTPRPL